MMKKQKYEAPALTAVEFKVERGYASSIPDAVDAVFGGIQFGEAVGTELRMSDQMDDLGAQGSNGYFSTTTSEGSGGGGYFGNEVYF